MKPIFRTHRGVLYKGDALSVLKEMPDESVDMVMTSPPYWGLRQYSGCPDVSWEDGWAGQLGLEPTFQLYIQHLMLIFDEVYRVLKDTGTCWVNLGDTYWGGNGSSGHSPGTTNCGRATDEYGAYGSGKMKHGRSYKNKSLCCIPDRFKIAMVDSGWICRNEIIWQKLSCMPSSAKDRFTIDFEKVFFFSKKQKYFFNQQFESMKRSSVDRYNRGVSPDNKYVDGAPGQTPHSMKQGKKNIKNIKKTKGGWSGGTPGRAYPNEKREQPNTWGMNPMGRNKRSVWVINSQGYNGEHYASFPEELVETPLDAGCPRQVCKKCGMPVTVVCQSDNPSKNHGEIDGMVGATPLHQGGNKQSSKSLHRNNRELKNTSQFIGLAKCDCDAGFEPGVCLDPFMGVGTVALVAEKNNKKWIGIEISTDYCVQMKDRLKEFTNQTRLVVE